MSVAYRQDEFSVTITRESDGSARAEVWVHLRSGGLHKAASSSWPRGAPTAAQLALFEAAVCDELQTLILTTVGVQGVLLALEAPGPAD